MVIYITFCKIKINLRLFLLLNGKLILLCNYYYNYDKFINCKLYIEI